MTTHSILGNTRRADISFYPSGKIDITSRIVKSLGIEAGDVIDIMIGNGEYYLYVAAHGSELCGRHEAQCYPSKRGTNHFRTYCRKLCSVILREAGIKNSHASFAAGDAMEIGSRTVIPIITRRNLSND